MSEKLEFKKDFEQPHSGDFWYDLSCGGYIKVEEILEPESAKRLRAAIAVVEEFESKLELEEM